MDGQHAGRVSAEEMSRGRAAACHHAKQIRMARATLVADKIEAALVGSDLLAQASCLHVHRAVVGLAVVRLG